MRSHIILFLLSLASLGKTSSEERIVNGIDAVEGAYPFQVSVRYNDRHICGGTLLSDLWVLSAAHCVAFTYNLYSVQAGTVVISEAGDYIIDVEQWFIHDDFEPNRGFRNDIALFRLQEPFIIGGLIGTVTLPNVNVSTPVGATAVLLGWGRNTTDGTYVAHLQRATLEVVADAQCAEAYNHTTHSTNVCAEAPGGAGGTGQCSGDSGGPLLVDGVQDGIVSWSRKPCAEAGFPGVFTEVSYYVEWIKQTIASNNGYKASVTPYTSVAYK